jgi:hypothetical protein
LPDAGINATFVAALRLAHHLHSRIVADFPLYQILTGKTEG